MGLIGWSFKLTFIVVLIGPRWVKPDPLGGPKSNVHSTPKIDLKVIISLEIQTKLRDM